MKTTKDMIEVMQASLEGKQIEQLDCNNSMSLWEPKNTDDNLVGLGRFRLPHQTRTQTRPR